MKLLLNTYALPGLVGRKIHWFSAQNPENGTLEGVARILAIDMRERRPITMVETISGDDGLKWAFIDAEGWYLCLGDEDRFILYEELNEEDNER